jgi:glycosyltransferase involved in cell wall biosynthesis
LLARLAARHEVTLLALVDPDEMELDGALPPGLAAVHRVPKRPWRPDDPLALLPRTVAGGYADPRFGAAVAARLAAERYDVVQYELIETAHFAPPPVCPSILTVHQVPFAQEGPAWRAGGRRVREGVIRLHRYLRELDFTLRAVGRVHHVVCVSDEDAARLRRFRPGLRVSVSPLGVDGDHFAPHGAGVPGAELVFVGNFEHPPNVDAVAFLVGEVLPRLRRAARVRIIGHGIGPGVAAHGRVPGVEVLGVVPDVRPYLAGAVAIVAPVRFGTGMRGKVLEGLATGRPVITTSLGAEGLGAASGVHLLVADGAEGLARAIDAVLGDPELAARLGRVGRALALARFGWDTVAARYEDIYDALLREPGSAGIDRADVIAPRAPRVGRLGHWPAVAAGFGVLVSRGLRWHARRLGGERAAARGRHATSSAGRAVADVSHP